MKNGRLYKVNLFSCNFLSVFLFWFTYFRLLLLYINIYILFTYISYICKYYSVLFCFVLRMVVIFIIYVSYYTYFMNSKCASISVNSFINCNFQNISTLHTLQCEKLWPSTSEIVYRYKWSSRLKQLSNKKKINKINFV